MRVGVAFALTGFVVLLPDAGLWLLLVAMLLIGLGLGFAIPGYTAGPTLLVRDEEQGALAGLIGATNGLTFIIAPTAATLLYGLGGWIPVAVSVVLLACVMLFLVLDPRFSAGQASA
jgi:DHA1 family tetracycline resistance protein-like MFS transporter